MADFWSDIAKIAVGGVVGSALALSASLYLANHQAALQRDQMILDRKISYLHEYSTISLRGPADRIARVVELRSRIDGILRPPSIDQHQAARVVQEYVSVFSGFAVWGSEQASGAAIISALTQIEAPRYPDLTLEFPRWDPLRSGPAARNARNYRR